MTEEEKKYREELEKENDGAIEIDENLDAAGNDLQAFANELGEHEKSKKKRFFGKFGGKGDEKAHKEIKELEEKLAKLDEQIKLKDEKIAELEGSVKSLVAENRNQKTRIENEFRSKIKFAVEDFFKDFITVKDDFDKAMAAKEGRTNLGGDIMIHGSNATIGCVPIGDEGIEDVFYLVAKVGFKNVEIVIAPYDMRKGRRPELEESSLAWYPRLCDDICAALSKSAR